MDDQNTGGAGRGPRRRLKWYSADATFKCILVGVPRKRHVWERTTLLVHAVDEDSATERAEGIAKEMELEYVGGHSDTVRWVFQEIEEVRELFDRKLVEGSEVRWEFFERVDKESAVG